MANCPECGAFVWDNQKVCSSCGTDLITGEKVTSTEQVRPEPLPMHPRTPIGQRRGKSGSSTSSGGRTRIGQRREMPLESGSTPRSPEEDAPLRRTRVGHRRNLDGGIAAGFRRGSYSNTITVGEIFSEAFKTMFKNPLIMVPSVIPMIWSVTAAISGVIDITGLIHIGDEEEQWDTVVTEFALWTILSLLIAFWSYAATIRMFAMATEKKGFSLLIDGIVTALERTFTLLISGLIFAIIIVIGSVLFVIPGVIAFILLFLFVQAIMVDNQGATSSLSKSMDVVRANLGGAIIIFLAILIIPTVTEAQAIVADDLPEWAASWANFLIAGVSLIVQVYVIGLATIFYVNRR